ncbi:putative disease resistance RPP13-like protein 1 isoform X4 [Arachis ipaensis]|uniref:putative disease resistance RPP13-like protein 1 isoform X4 n=1 Tax=Arachis ipaensis TaxID=130454 RepID=UPI000A2B95E3|nr:putative disease resistance RPP13-like protein 1 isoform X4 [Arachis ipaensis]
MDAGALVDDAELKQLDNHDVKEWLNCLRDALYTADDLLDCVCTKAATQKGVRNFLPSFLNSEERQMVKEIERVVRRIEDLEKRKGKLGLEKISTASFSWKTTSTSLVKGNVYGREDDQKALVQMLNDNNEHHLSVISIVGIGGVGKTTLAQWMYNNAELMEGFDRKAWVCVSENFNIVETTRNIVKEISTNTQDLDSFNSIQDALKKGLSEKKFFIVLDDVWSNDHHQWKDFLAPFQYGVKGSTILLTTRKEDVGSVVQTNYHPHYLIPLSEDYCWSVFAANASFPESNGSPTLEGIGKKIARKCDGLPLAAETLGCLCRRHDAEEWEKILRSDIWGFSTIDSKIIPALLISYFHLPAHLKRCFVYCALYPKDYLLDKDELILLWMAQDLLRLPNRGESFEEVGCNYFEELASRLFFKPSTYNFKRFVMHDLLRDLAIFLAGDFYCRIEELGEQDEKKVLTRHLSHISCGSLGPRISKVSNSILKLESLRTSLYIDDLFNLEIIGSKFKYLRVLSFHKLDVLPESIGELIHLRYLNLSWTDINMLPELLCNLYNLQTLILYGCTKLTMLPSGMHNLVNLRHLDLRKTSLEEMPGGISKLKHLRVLDFFIVGKHEDNGIHELGGLSNLHGSFQLKKLENIVDVKEAENARMINKNLISKLYLEWSSGGDMVSNTQTEREILHSLEPHNGLKELTIRRYRGTIFPDWLGHCSYNNMTHISLVCCMNCCMLPSLGQLPSLKSLYIRDFGQLSSIGIEFYKNEDDPSLHIAPFPSLETLQFQDMPCWEVWNLPDSETFRQLKSLQITDCPMLKGDILNQVFLRVISSLSSDVSKICKLSIQKDHKGRSQEMLLKGDTLLIKGCESVMGSAFKAMSINLLTYLQEIQISGCSYAVSFRGDCLPKSLQKLTILNCSKLEFPQQKYNFMELYIKDSCDSLSSFSLDDFPNLNNLRIEKCENLKSLSLSQPPHAALKHLFIDDCCKFVSFPVEGLAAPNLTHLRVTYCYKLESLPANMNTLLPNLHSLEIQRCSEICKLPKGGFPPNLKELSVGGCEEQLKGLSSMCHFNALIELTIEGYFGVTSYPKVGSLPQLPSLTTLRLWGFLDLETLECDQLLHLTSLQQLHIQWCVKLENMAGQKLPSSLLLLQIIECPLLGEHCKKKDEQYWSKIFHIPTIQVDGEQIF